MLLKFSFSQTNIISTTQCDQPKQGLVAISSKMDDYVKQNNFAGWYETSARDNINIDEAARALVGKVSRSQRLKEVKRKRY